jgi:hypothetical protein
MATPIQADTSVDDIPSIVDVEAGVDPPHPETTTASKHPEISFRSRLTPLH